MTNSKFKKLSVRCNSRAAAVIVFAARLCDVGMAAHMWNWCCYSPELIVFWPSGRASSTLQEPWAHTDNLLPSDPSFSSRSNSNLALTINLRCEFPRVTREAGGAESRPWSLFRRDSGNVGLVWSCLNGRDCFPVVVCRSFHYLLLRISLNYSAFAALKFARMSHCTRSSSLVSEWNFTLIQFIILLADTWINTPVFCCLNADITWHEAEDECRSPVQHIWAVLIILSRVDSPQLILWSVDLGRSAACWFACVHLPSGLPTAAR